ncbi:MAG TPA: LysE family translocator [Steroidobacteraceae bacterium]|jgi:threonine/homoserine/homoserine lactone efflux protein|nr:LysE family translocator [Steroidobacteraceae bacterium]
MTITQALTAYCVAAALLTIAPGLDTALILRTAAAEGAKSAALAALGVVMGCLTWGAAVAFGLGALLAASELAFTVLKWAGALYLVWFGLNLILKPRSQVALGAADGSSSARGRSWLGRGYLTNLLNPKVGVFYVSFLPQFLPAHVPAGPFIFLLAVLQALMGIVWFGLLIVATRPIARALKRPSVIRSLDRLTGVVFLSFGVKLALVRQR